MVGPLPDAKALTAAPAAIGNQCRITVCRGCCCGDRDKHPDVDHDELLADLQWRVDGVASVRVVDCLLVCGDSNVVVVSPRPEQRRQGTGPVWLGRILSGELNTLIGRWVHAGGPGAAPIPVGLRPNRTLPFPGLTPTPARPVQSAGTGQDLVNRESRPLWDRAT
jgi:hypothetical protein